MKSLYADFNASAPLCPNVRKMLIERMDTDLFANPSAGHVIGRQIAENIEATRNLIADNVKVHRDHVIFNSGSSEGIANVFFSLFVEEKKPIKKKILISTIEHSAIVDNTNFYAKKFNQETKWVNVNQDGLIDLEAFEKSVKNSKDEITLVCIMAANNETGVIQPYKEIGKLCQDHGIPFLCDTTQLVGKVPFDFNDSNIDYAFASGHKFGALLGSGFIMVKDLNAFSSLIKGGGQEHGLRSGTQNYLAIETLGVAISSFDAQFRRIPLMEKARNEFEAGLKADLEDIFIFGENAPRVPTTTYLAQKNSDGQLVRQKLEKVGVYITTSSACSDQGPTGSKVLRAMNIPFEYQMGALRMSLCLSCQPEEYQIILEALKTVLRQKKKVSA
ncbi:MAG: cysteine desulfurase family protein [Bacteriovoracaceae bacterium]